MWRQSWPWTGLRSAPMARECRRATTRTRHASAVLRDLSASAGPLCPGAGPLVPSGGHSQDDQPARGSVAPRRSRRRSAGLRRGPCPLRPHDHPGPRGFSASSPVFHRRGARLRQRQTGGPGRTAERRDARPRPSEAEGLTAPTLPKQRRADNRQGGTEQSRPACSAKCFAGVAREKRGGKCCARPLAAPPGVHSTGALLTTRAEQRIYAFACI